MWWIGAATHAIENNIHFSNSFRLMRFSICCKIFPWSTVHFTLSQWENAKKKKQRREKIVNHSINVNGKFIPNKFIQIEKYFSDFEVVNVMFFAFLVSLLFSSSSARNFYNTKS